MMKYLEPVIEFVGFAAFVLACAVAWSITL